MSDSITSATFQMTREMVHQWGWFWPLASYWLFWDLPR